MHRLSRLIRVLAFATCGLTESMIFAQVVETSHLNISVYNDAGVPRDVLARSEERAAMIFSHAGFELSWTNHGYRFSDHGSKFKEISEPGDLVMRIIPRAATSTNNAVFGVSFLGPDGTGRYSDVFWTKVKELHTNYNVDITGVLGSVMAHEIGHLLLGSQAHAVSGIMRARWESHELHQIAMGTLLFLPWQEQRMRIRVTELAARTSRPGLAHRASAQIY